VFTNNRLEASTGVRIQSAASLSLPSTITGSEGKRTKHWAYLLIKMIQWRLSVPMPLYFPDKHVIQGFRKVLAEAG
jgi:hypothetical protein